jgi:Na+-translocating ferredoxin:NAD+ oxidoreductase subunit D
MPVKVRRLLPVPLPRMNLTVPGIMTKVILALVPAALFAIIVYGAPAAAVILAAVFGMIGSEITMKAVIGNRQRILDGSSLLSGMLLGLMLPPGISIIWVFCGSFIGGIVAKQLFGGMGRNPLNPALLTRLGFSLFAASELRTGQLHPFWWRNTDASWWPEPIAASTSTILESIKETCVFLDRALDNFTIEALPVGWPELQGKLEIIHYAQDIIDGITPKLIIWPTLPGTLGEASILALLPGIIYLMAVRIIDWRIPLAAFVPIAIGVVLFKNLSADTWISTSLVLQSTSLTWMLFIFAADPVTSPVSQKGKVIYGTFVGLMVLPVLTLDQAGGLILVVLLANLLSPWIDRVTMPGGPKNVRV